MCALGGQSLKKLEDSMTWQELAEYTANRIEKNISPKWKRKHFIDWFLKREKVGYRFDWRLIYRAYKICKDLENEGDNFTVIVGKEGSGKTTCGLQLAAWTSPETFSIDYICYKATQYLKLIKDLIKKRQEDKLSEKVTIVLDEAALDLFSRKSMSKSNIDLSQIFFIQRILNVHVILCIPDFFGLDTIVREHRVSTLIVMQKQRGNYKAITGKGISIVIQNYRKYGKNLNHHPIPYGCFWTGSFNKPFPNTIDTKEYIRNKLANVDDFVKKCLEGVQENLQLMPISRMAKQIGSSNEKIKRMIKSGDLDGKKIGDRWYVSPESCKAVLSRDFPAK